MPDTPILEVSHIHFRYPYIQILEDVSLRMVPGDFAALIGPNGGGKTTLMKIILGLLTPQSGRVKIHGTPIHKARHLVSYVPQYAAFNQHFPITVLDTVLQGCLGKQANYGWKKWLYPGVYSKQDYTIARQVMRETFTWNLRHQPISQLSGGQLQRVMVARALAGQPRLLLLDEPTANIDQRSEKDIFDLFRELNQRMSILVISHDIGFVSAYVNKVFCLNKTLLDHQPEEVDSHALHQLYGDKILSVHHHSAHCGHH